MDPYEAAVIEARAKLLEAEEGYQRFLAGDDDPDTRQLWLDLLERRRERVLDTEQRAAGFRAVQAGIEAGREQSRREDAAVRALNSDEPSLAVVMALFADDKVFARIPPTALLGVGRLMRDRDIDEELARTAEALAAGWDWQQEGAVATFVAMLDAMLVPPAT